MINDNILVLDHVSKHFGGVRALDDVNLELRRGEAHCLVGENGSGKSTLIKIVSGAIQPDAGGRVILDGQPVQTMSPTTSTQLGVQVIYQDHSLFPHLSVAENITLGLKASTNGLFVSRRAQREQAQRILERMRVKIDVRKSVQDLPVSSRQIVAICRAVAAGGRLLIMDEPTASLTSREVRSLLTIVDELRREGMTIVFVSHRLQEVRDVAERVSVLRDGRKLGTFAASQVDDRKLANLMTGREFSFAPRRLTGERRTLFQVENLTRPGEFENISFAVDEGEVLGIVGALGAGRTELALTLFGIEKPAEGRMMIGGKPYLPNSNRDALDNGVAYLPEDRLTLGLVLPQSIERNMTVSVLRKFSGVAGSLNLKRLATLVKELVANLKIKASNVAAPVATLSGGNQQRVALARLIATQPKLLILDCPTVGVDIGAKDAIFEIVHRMAAKGLGVILISDEESEVLQQAHRILTMRQGRMVAEYQPDLTSEEELRQVVHG